jgi:phosphoglycolate phosphatase
MELNMNNQKYVLFDLDGTLTDPGPGITNSVMYALRAFGIEPPVREDLYKFIGPPLAQSFEEFYGFSPEKAREAIIKYREYYSDIGIYENELYQGMPTVLDFLKNRGYNLLVATSKLDIFARRILEHFKISEYFDFVAGADINETRSEKADVIAYALKNINNSNSNLQAVMVGDRTHDIIGAKKCGLKSVGVLYGYGNLEELTQAGADVIAAAVADIPKAVSAVFDKYL